VFVFTQRAERVAEGRQSLVHLEQGIQQRATCRSRRSLRSLTELLAALSTRGSFGLKTCCAVPGTAQHVAVAARFARLPSCSLRSQFAGRSSGLVALEDWWAFFGEGGGPFAVIF